MARGALADLCYASDNAKKKRWTVVQITELSAHQKPSSKPIHINFRYLYNNCILNDINTPSNLFLHTFSILYAKPMLNHLPNLCNFNISGLDCLRVHFCTSKHMHTTHTFYKQITVSHWLSVRRTDEFKNSVSQTKFSN